MNFPKTREHREVMDIYAEPENVDPEIVANLGPLRPLAGIWEGDQGLDVAPSSEGSDETPYRERLTLEPMGPVLNGPQILYGLRYATTAWPIGEEDAFHEEVGYWLWSPRDTTVMRCFIVPRAVTVLAGATLETSAKTFTMSAECGSKTFGISSGPFLDQHFQTVRYDCEIQLHPDGSFSYHEDTQLKIQGTSEIFHHTDRNTLRRVQEF